MYGVQSAAHNNFSPVQLYIWVPKAPKSMARKRSRDPSDLGAFLWSSKGGYPYPCSATMRTCLDPRKGCGHVRMSIMLYNASYDLPWNFFTIYSYIMLYITLLYITIYIYISSTDLVCIKHIRSFGPKALGFDTHSRQTILPAKRAANSSSLGTGWLRKHIPSDPGGQKYSGQCSMYILVPSKSYQKHNAAISSLCD